MAIHLRRRRPSGYMIMLRELKNDFQATAGLLVTQGMYETATAHRKNISLQLFYAIVSDWKSSKWNTTHRAEVKLAMNPLRRSRRPRMADLSEVH